MTTFHWHNAKLVAEHLTAIHNSHEGLPAGPGIYFFSRQFGEGDYEPFYVGRSRNVGRRLCQYLNNKTPHETRIRNVLEGRRDQRSGRQIGNGRRYFHCGELVINQGPNRGLLKNAERALTHLFLIDGWKLINVQHNREPEFEMTGSLYDGLLSKRLLSPRAR